MVFGGVFISFKIRHKFCPFPESGAYKRVTGRPGGRPVGQKFAPLYDNSIRHKGRESKEKIIYLRSRQF
jgi:hypothetical protein